MNMKKLLLSLVALMGVVCTNAQDIKFVMDEVEVPQGGSVVVPINIENTIDCYSWEAWIGVEGVNVTNGDIRFSRYAKGDRIQNIPYHKITIDEETGEIVSEEDVDDGAFDTPYEPSKGDDGIYYWRIVGYNTGGFSMTGNSGPVAYITFSAPETVEIGTEFTGYIDNIHFGKEGGVDVPGDKITFNIKVVENRVVLDEDSETAPIATTESVNVLVKRTLKADTWSTICLPFAMTEAQVKEAFGDDVQVADFTGCEASGEDGDYYAAIKVKFATVSSMDANHPYLIKVSTPISHDEGFKVDGVNISPEEDPVIQKDHERVKVGTKWYDYYNNFFGTYVANTAIDAGSVILSGNKFYITKGTSTKGFRGWFFFDNIAIKDIEAAMAEGSVKMLIDDDPTAVENIDIVANPEGIFDMSGRKLNNMPKTKGVYVIDGKKVTIK